MNSLFLRGEMKKKMIMSKVFRILFVFILIVPLFMPVGKTYAETESQLVEFVDKKLEEAVASHLGMEIGHITTQAMKDLSFLVINDLGVNDLSGLEQATNLETFLARQNNIQDLTPLENLTNLSWVDLSNNGLTDITPLRNTTKLRDLSLGHNKISDITALENASSLTGLSLYDNLIHDISPLGNLTALTFLTLSLNRIEDISPLLSLSKLDSLHLDSNHISDITPLKNLSNINFLTVYHNKLNLEDNETKNTIEHLQNRNLSYFMYENFIDIVHVSNDTFTVSWENFKTSLRANKKYISLNGEVLNVDPYRVKSHTITNLSPETPYVFGFHVWVNEDMYDYIYLKVFTLDQSVDFPDIPRSVVVVPVISNDNVLTMDDVVLQNMTTKSTITVDLAEVSGEDKTIFKLSANQLVTLHEKDVTLNLEKQNVKVHVPLSNFEDDLDIEFSMEKTSVAGGENAVSEIYSFHIKQGDTYIRQFATPITLSFEVDVTNVSDTSLLKVFYFNEEKQNWELVGGTFENGFVTANVDHFSTYAVFASNQVITEEEEETTELPVTEDSVVDENREDENVTSPIDESGSNEEEVVTEGSNNTEENSSEKEGLRLPDTATNAYNYMMIGFFGLLAGLLVLFSQRRRLARM